MRQVHQKTVVFQDLRDFVQRAADVANDPIFGKDALLQGLTQRSTDTKGTPNQGTPKANGSSFATNVTPDNSASEGKQAKTSCPLCSQTHDLESCKSFRAKTVDDRRAFIKDKFLCFGCYGPNHTARGCLQRRKCNKCQKPHPTLLHVDDYQPPRHQRAGGNHNGAASGGAQETQQRPVSHANDSDSARVSSAYAATTSNRSQPSILHGILPVKIHQRGSDQYVTTYCFYDNGSSGCFVSNDLFHQLGAKGTPTRLQLTTMHGVSHVDSSVVSDLIITDMDGNNAVSMPKTYTRDAIPVTAQHIPKPEVTSQWKHLQAIESKLPTFQPGLEVGILVGSNCPQALEPSDIIPTDGAGPYALRLRHGWTVYGPSKAPTQGEQVLCNRIFIQEAAKEEMSPEAIIQTLEMDFNERKPTYPDEKGQSQEDIKFMHMVEEKIQFENGHYIVPLPLRHTNVSLPNNRSQAMQRLLAQKKKMMRDQKYHSDYTAFVNKILDKDYAERVVSPQSNNDQRQTWYLPHHGIYNPNKPDKIRVVFDASAKYCGSSLNDHLLQGPDLANNLVGVLTRFRQHPTAFIADIEAMFFQVRVPVEQRNFLRFLWWEDGDINKEIQEFRMNVHLFGAISSPSVANFVLKKIGAISPNLEVQQTLKRNFYVDDCLKAVSTSTAAVSLIHELTATCAAKGFRLTKYTSNNPDVMKSIPTEEHSKEMLTRNLDYDELPVTRTLGIQWNAEQDQFGFAIEVKEKPMTRRGILSTISSLYDPLGFAAPVTLPAKQILQDLCREKNIGWDDKIPQEYLERWEKWRSAIGELTECRIERCCKPPNVAEEWKTELHVFADASMLGYGAVAFLRHLDQDGKFHMSFVMGKARIAPIKAVSIPRLELTAAVTSVRLSKLIEHEIDEELRVIYHTDSTTVLRFIRNERQRFPIFVANRVQLIRDFSTPQQWRYVPSAQNPADVGSRGITAKELQQSMWIHGPAFLEKDEGDWPEDPTELAAEFPNEALCDEQVGCNATQEQEDDAVTRLIHHYSDWFKLQYAVAVFQKVKQILKARIKHKKDDSTNQVEANLTVRDIKEAETSILKWLQHQRYPNEMTCLRSIQANQDRDRSLPRNSSLYRLDPYLVDGMMRVGGRLARANLSENEKHPIILPRKSHITTLAIRHEHERLGHAGRNHVLANLQTKYWIISGNSAVRTVINACVTCRRLRGQAQTQKMADLPACRVDETSPPFTQMGVDYFGPFVIKQGRKEVKRYGVIFTCMASRAIHLEASESLETDTFINVLRRFIARRGNVIQIWSDNGTNFKGAQKELRKSLEEMKSDQIQATMCKSGIEWRFNPPTASNMGGVWERMIRTVRKVLQGLMQDHSTRLDNDSFHTLLCEVEAIVNSRPIAYVSSDHKDLEALTPNHILTLKSKVTVPPPGIFRREDVYLRRRWRQVQYLAEQFWSRWKKEYLLLQQTRTKWTKQQRNIAVGDIVLIQDDNAPRNAWSMGRVQAVESDSKGLVRAALLKTQTTQLRRPINKMILLVPSV